jgi:hypothetical protein
MTQITQNEHRILFYAHMVFLEQGNNAQLEWAIFYLAKKGKHITTSSSITMIKDELWRMYTSQPDIQVSAFFTKMEKAWKAYAKRKTSASAMLNVCISSNHIEMFNKMVKGANCTKIQMLEALIDDNYKALLHSKDVELRAKEEKRAQFKKEKASESKINKELRGKLLISKNYINGHKTKIRKLNEIIEKQSLNSSHLFEIIKKTAANGASLTQQDLIDATMLYTLTINQDVISEELEGAHYPSRK